jgi:hypothetical protein
MLVAILDGLQAELDARKSICSHGFSVKVRKLLEKRICENDLLLEKFPGFH